MFLPFPTQLFTYRLVDTVPLNISWQMNSEFVCSFPLRKFWVASAMFVLFSFSWTGEKLTFYASFLCKSYPITGLERPLGLQEVEAPCEFLDSCHMKVVRLSALCIGCLPSSHEIFLVIISARPELTLSGNKPATLRLLVQCLNKLCHCMPPGFWCTHAGLCAHMNYEMNLWK